MNHPRTWTRIPPESVLQSVLEVYESGRTLDALKRATDFAPLKDWDGTRGCSLAGRIAMNAGGTRLASRLAVRSWRADKTHPLAQFDYGFQLFLRRGPLAFQVRAKSWPPVTGDKATWQADVVALKATAATELRDFKAAEELLGQAELLAPRSPWPRLQRAQLVARTGRAEEALELALAACKLHSYRYYRPGVQVVAHLLRLLDREGEAIDLLQRADAALQNGQLALQLYNLFFARQQWKAAEEALDRHAALTPLAEPPAKRWIAAQRASLAVHLGQRPTAPG